VGSLKSDRLGDASDRHARDGHTVAHAKSGNSADCVSIWRLRLLHQAKEVVMKAFCIFLPLMPLVVLEPACSSSPGSHSTANDSPTWQVDLDSSIGPGSAEPTTIPDGAAQTANQTAGNQQGQGNGCSGACCSLPTEGSACPESDDGQSCSAFAQCPGGLSLAATLACTGGRWQKVSEPCPALDGGVTAGGCPARQPSAGAACSTSEGSVCTYVLTCGLPSCDAASTAALYATAGNASTASGTACASSIDEIAEAVCTGGSWATEPLAPCP
jgi:hypothetical protein